MFEKSKAVDGNNIERNLHWCVSLSNVGTDSPYYPTIREHATGYVTLNLPRSYGMCASDSIF